jgi:predicted nucleic acid-binding protein
MSAETFVDTNVLLYAYDSTSGKKQLTAQVTLEELWRSRTGILSMRVLQEFYVNVTAKIGSPVPREVARRIIERYSHWCIATGPGEVRAAFRIEDEARISFWDALIVAAALRAGASRILSEDLSAGQRIAGVLIENPFAS